MYRLKPANKRKVWRADLLKASFAALAVLATVLALDLSAGARSFVSGAFSPFFKAGDSFYGNLSAAPLFFGSKSRLVEENQLLSEELEKARVKAADYDALRSENQRLREEMKLKPAGKFISAYVAARAPQVPLDTLLVNRGAADGIAVGNPVLSGERVLLGKVAKIYGNKAVVSLNSLAEAATYGYVERTGEPIELKGDGGGSIKSKVPIDFDIAEGDRIMVNGYAPYLAAVAGLIEKDEASGFKEAFLSLPVNASKTNIVFIEPTE